MDDLLQLPSHTIPVTICCAGNRRKEQNMIRPSIGFSWGPAGNKLLQSSNECHLTFS